jgi:hypothetical protein
MPLSSIPDTVATSRAAYTPLAVAGSSQCSFRKNTKNFLLPGRYHPYHQHLSDLLTLAVSNKGFLRSHTQTQAGGLGIGLVCHSVPLVQSGFAQQDARPAARRPGLNPVGVQDWFVM